MASHEMSPADYLAPPMADKKKPKWVGWGARYRQALRLKGLNLAKIAAKMDMHESSLRSWTNGHRDPNLSDFFRLCDAAEIDPEPILFGGSSDEILLAVQLAWSQASESERKLLEVAARAVLEEHGKRHAKGSHTK